MFAASTGFSQPVMTPERGGVGSKTAICYHTQGYIHITYFIEPGRDTEPIPSYRCGRCEMPVLAPLRAPASHGE